jgi:hypothetical protein
MNKKNIICLTLITSLLSLGFLGCTKKQETTSKNPSNTTNTESTLKPTPTPIPKKSIRDIKVKSAYLSGELASKADAVDKLISLIKETELNTVVLDVKEKGLVNYKSSVPEVQEIKSYVDLYNPKQLVEKFHNNGIFVIARVVCFKDHNLATKKPDLAIKSATGKVFYENGKTAWVNPYNKLAWEYNVKIAKEAIDLGFDEIQFDYVRFPTAPKSQTYYGENPAPRTTAISDFLSYASKEISPTNIPISADVFGIACISKADADLLGQDITKMTEVVDYICPMIYPSHYSNAAPSGVCANGQGQSINGVMFKAPDLEPYKVMFNTLQQTKKFMDAASTKKAKLRPYLQSFTASYLPNGYYQTYGAQQIKDQIKATYDAGFEEWILWNASSTFNKDSLEKKQ